MRQLSRTGIHRAQLSRLKHNGRRNLFTPARRLAQAASTNTNTRSQSSVSQSEVSHFNALASSWWDPHGPSRLLHLMNPLRHAFIAECLATRSPGPNAAAALTYLDVGCGGGIFAESAARLRSTAAVTGIDPSRDVLTVARAHARRDPALGRLSYENCAVEDLPRPAPGGGYDVVSLFEVVEHVATPSTFLEQVARQVKPGGWLVMSTIARTWSSWLTTKVIAEGILNVVPWGTHDWNKYVDEKELRDYFMSGKPRGGALWEHPRAMGVVYVPGLGWKEVAGGEEWGNYFFAVRKREDGQQ